MFERKLLVFIKKTKKMENEKKVKNGFIQSIKLLFGFLSHEQQKESEKINSLFELRTLSCSDRVHYCMMINEFGDGKDASEAWKMSFRLRLKSFVAILAWWQIVFRNEEYLLSEEKAKKLGVSVDALKYLKIPFSSRAFVHERDRVRSLVRQNYRLIDEKSGGGRTVFSLQYVSDDFLNWEVLYSSKNSQDKELSELKAVLKDYEFSKEHQEKYNLPKDAFFRYLRLPFGLKIN